MKNIIYITILFFLFSCTEKEKNLTFKYSAKIDTVTQNVPFSDLVEDYKFIKLETDSNCLIGEIQQLLVGDDKLYVVSDGIYCFDMKGKFIYAIDRKGRGPGEYTQINSVSLSNNKLYLYDNLQWRISVFSCANGRFEKEIKMPSSVLDAYVVDDAIIMRREYDMPNVLAKNDEYVLVCKKDAPNKLINAYFEKRDYGSMWRQHTYCGNGMFFVDHYHSQAYKVTPKGMEPYFELNITADKRLSETEIDRMIKRREYKPSDEGKEYIMGLFGVYEDNNFISGNTYDRNIFHTFLYDKRSNKAILLNAIIVKDSYQSMNGEFLAAKDDYHYMALSSHNMAALRDVEGKIGKLLPKDSPEYEQQQIYINTKSEDNPIIALYKFKPIK